jgi:hypothetical protein
MTSGGTESLLLAIKSYRDRARVITPHITRPEIVMSVSVHVAVPKGQPPHDATTRHGATAAGWEIESSHDLLMLFVVRTRQPASILM